MFVLNHHVSIANQYLAEIRDVSIQKDRQKFRNNLRRLGFLLGYEISKELRYTEKSISTPLAKAKEQVPSEDLVIITILRAGLPFQEGFMEAFDQADAGFVGAWRNDEGEKIEIELNYLATGDLNQKTVILVDPMLATGKSLVKVVDKLLTHGTPKTLHLAAAIAAPEGVGYLKQNLKLDYQLWMCALDEKLNQKSYIVPGLGDAGDLAFGAKM